MGWTCTSNEAGKSTLRMLREHSSWHVGSTWGNETHRYEVIALQAGGGGVYGILRRTTLATASIFDMALILLVQRGRGEFCWKEMDEFCGPVEDRMPSALFRRLTPLDQSPAGESRENAEAWRARVQRQLDHAAQRSAQKPGVGDIVVFDETISFRVQGATVKVNRFRIHEWGRRRRLVALPDDGNQFDCRLLQRTWQSSAFRLERRANPVLPD